MPLTRLITKPSVTNTMTLNSDFTPRSCQVDMQNASISQNKGFWLADCGVGKSRSALMAIASVNASMSLIITAKAAVLGVWPEEIEDTLVGVEYLPLVKGTSKRKAADMIQFAATCQRANVPGIVIVNYETARLLPLDVVKWDMVVCDESHKLQGHSSKQSRTLARLNARIPHKIMMTGTAFEDKPLSVYGQMRWLNPVLNGTHWQSADFGNWSTFFEKYTEYYQKDNIKIPTGYKNLDHMAEVLAPYFLRIAAEDVLDLPPVSEITKKVQLEPTHRKAYDELYNDMVTRIDGNMVFAQNVLVLATRLHQMTGGYYQPFDIRMETQSIKYGDAKLQALLDIVEEIGGHPIVIFTKFRDDVKSIRSAFRKRGITYRELTGERDEHREWRAGKAQVLIANISAGGTGINLGRANYMIYYSVGHSRTEYMQSRDRVIPRTNKPVFIYHILAENTIDEQIYRVLQSKGDVANELKGLLQNG